ncbi:hypothetical protein WA026_010416 [Henosepilachna vigintioctopunctata]|uniref:Protein rolling stone n=1 Tax=Henosepilachna vigintioctopunctata TaxID=420089 RepID=A0AAW1V4Y8_9CUCU
MLNIFRNTFSLKELSLKVDDPEVFVTCQWQRNRNQASIYYLIYRWIISIYFLVTQLFSILEVSDTDPAWYQAKYPIYLTNWGYTLCTLQALLAAIMLSFSMLGYKEGEFHLPQVLKIYKIYWLIHVIATPLAFIITIIYWTMIYDAKTAGLEVLNIIVHGTNSIIMFFDFWMVSNPVRLAHILYPVIFSSCYVAFSVIYYLAGGTSREGTTYIYPILDWSKATKSLLVCFVVGLFAVFLHVVIFCMYVIKKKIFKKLIQDRNVELPISMTTRKNQSGYVNDAVIMGDEF